MLIIALLCLLKEAFAANIAFGKRATKCGNIAFASITDGIMKPLILTNYCVGDPFITVYLGRYFVNYVIVFTGELNLDLLGQLGAYQIVNIADEMEITCGSYPNSLLMQDFSRGLRTNCLTWTKPAEQTIINFPLADILKISEVEVHTLGDDKTGEVTIYRGCFGRFFSTRFIEYKNFKSCRKFCAAQNSPLMAIEEKIYCHCGIDYDFKDELKLSRCDIKCEGDAGYCGGSFTFSVYIVNVQLPYFFGCARNTEPGKTIKDNVTIERCLQLCSNFSFIWLTENTCGCASAPLPETVFMYQCTHTCSGDPTELCGGNGYASVYSTCRSTPTEFLTCEKLFHCANGYDKFGVCIGGCKSGFAGEHCIEKVSDAVEEATRGYDEFSRSNVIVSQGSKTLTKMNVILNLFCASLMLFFL